MNSSDGWLTNLSQADVLSFIPSNALGCIDDLDKAADVVLADYSAGIENRKRLTTDGKEKKDLTFRKEAWLQLKKEFYVLLCTEDESYKNVRVKLASSGNAVTVLLVALVAQSLGDKLGIVCGPVVTLVALMLCASLRLGRQTMCGVLAKQCGN
jgi:hypothetical protein